MTKFFTRYVMADRSAAGVLLFGLAFALTALTAIAAHGQVTAEGTAFGVNSYTSGSQAHASVAMDAGGDFVIVWDSGYLGNSAGRLGRRSVRPALRRQRLTGWN